MPNKQESDAEMNSASSSSELAEVVKPEVPQLKTKAGSDGAISTMQRILRDKTAPITGIKLGKRRRSENQCIEASWQDFLKDQ